MLEFVMGVLIGLLYVSSFQVKKLVVNSLLAAGITGLLASVFLDYGKISGVGYTLDGSLTFKRVLLWGLPAALLVGSLVLNEKRRVFSIHPWWTLIGDASYSIYLTHAVILASLYVRWVEWGIIKNLSPDALLVLSMLLAITGGCIFYKLVELPILRFMNKQLAIANNSIARNGWFLKLVKDTA
jgi:peptidoglycan/LPS O-acetylase OafA/YrhL